MASFGDCLSNSKVNQAYIRRNAFCMDLNSAISNVCQLDRESPKLRQFITLEKEAESLLGKVKTENNMMVQLMMQVAPDISSDGGFTQDQTSIRGSCLQCITKLDEYRTLLEQKNLIPSLDEQQAAAAAGRSTDVTNMLNQLSKNLASLTEIGKGQSETSKRHVDLLAISKGPKPVQPTFHPKGEVSDYLVYKNFIDRFDYFIKDVTDPKDRQQWFLTSVKGDAFEAIKGLTINASNYDVARGKLDKKYLDSEKIQKAIFSSIYHFQVSNPDKTYQNVLQGLTTLENHIMELKNVHSLDCTIGAADKLVSLIIMQNLPSQLRNELINLTETTYPSLLAIFGNMDKVVEKVNEVTGVSTCYPKTKNVIGVSVNSVGSNANKRRRRKSKKCIDDSTSKSVVAPVMQTTPLPQHGNKKPDSGSPKSGPPKNQECRLCGKDHTTRLCATFTSVEDRKKAFFGKFGMQCCELCFNTIHKGSCNPRAVCTLRFCPSKQAHAIILCPYNIEQ